VDGNRIMTMGNERRKTSGRVTLGTLGIEDKG
jgi:hypothetical protein